jgi:thioredoxin reductase (NADPH)
MELGQLMHRQAESQGAETLMAEVLELVPAQDGRLSNSEDERGNVESAVIIIATGSRYRLLGAPERLNSGQGRVYCATCDGPFYRGKRVAVLVEGTPQSPTRSN